MAVKTSQQFDSHRLPARSPGPGTLPPRRSGFVLPMTLLVIALTAIVMVGVARRSLQRAADANQAHLDLQRKWGTISCQRTLLDDADRWLTLPPEALPNATGDASHLRTVFSLGDCDFDVLLADENAKLNLNAVQKTIPWPQVVGLATELARSAQPIQVDLRPYSSATVQVGEGEQMRNLARLDSWGQIFPMRQFANPRDAPRRIAAATLDLTCWGNGKLNVFTTSEAALASLCQRLGDRSIARELIRQRQPGITWEAMLSTLELEQEQVSDLATFLTDRSSTYSLWLHVTTASKSWYEFYVVSHPEDSAPAGTDAGGISKLDQPTPAFREVRSLPVQQARFAW